MLTLLLCLVLGAVVIAHRANAIPQSGRLVIYGPGLTRPVFIDSHTAAWMYFVKAGLWSLVQGETGDAQPPGELGPRYHVVFFHRYVAYPTHYFPFPTEEQALRQDLYPFASSGAWAFTPAGQKFTDGDGHRTAVRSGWWAVPGDLTNVLEAHGLPSRPPTEVATARGFSAAFVGAVAGGTSVMAFLLGLYLATRRAKNRRQVA